LAQKIGQDGRIGRDWDWSRQRRSNYFARSTSLGYNQQGKEASNKDQLVHFLINEMILK
jgi:hypothetical protein